MTWQEFTALLVLATAMSFSPGPNTTLSTALAANGGLRRAMPFVCAVPLGWSTLLLLCALGLGALLLAVPMLALAVKLVGVAYLVWLAFKLSQSRTLGQSEGETDAARLQVGFWQGVVLQFVNIKAWMLALAIVSGWVAGRADTAQRLAVVVPTMLVFAFASNLLYATLGSLLRDWLRGPLDTGRRLLGFNRVMAFVLLITAFWMLTL